jgi:hypothetical protein
MATITIEIQSPRTTLIEINVVDQYVRVEYVVNRTDGREFERGELYFWRVLPTPGPTDPPNPDTYLLLPQADFQNLAAMVGRINTALAARFD